MHTEIAHEYLFRRIKEQIPVTASLADVIAEKLFISNDSAYRRIRGETPLVLEEAKILCEAFSISMDTLFKAKKNLVCFTSIEINNESYGFQKYLQEILGNLKYIHSQDQKELIYLTKDVAIFHNFLYRPLFAFRYFFWMKSILQHPEYHQRQFSMDVLSPEIEQTGMEIIKLYNKIPSTEIWNTECINSTISQIEYYREAGYFKNESDIENIYSCLHQLIDHLRMQAESGCKFLPGENQEVKQSNFSFFYNRMVLGDNTIMAILNGRKSLYLNYDVLNYMFTQDENFCNSVYEKLQNLMKRATQLSMDSDKQRNIFFNILLRKIPQVNTKQ